MTWSTLLHDPQEFLRQAVNSRGVRFIFYLVAAATIFPSSRFILFSALIVTLAILWTKEYYSAGSRKIVYLLAAMIVIVGSYFIARYDAGIVNKAREAKSPWGSGIALVKDGYFVGKGEGFRGPIEVGVTVKDGRIAELKTLIYPDLISVLDNEVARYKSQILSDGKLDAPKEPAMYRGARLTLSGYIAAMESALTKGIPDYPQYTLFSKAFLGAFIGKAPSRVTLNSLAILFAVFLVFEYTLQSVMTPGTGRAINCYNCATCVGACPVKEVEGVQMPMGLVLLTRLGEYERVAELSKYCVGCGRCAAKCPIGNSGPLVISAAFQAARNSGWKRSSSSGRTRRNGALAHIYRRSGRSRGRGIRRRERIHSERNLHAVPHGAGRILGMDGRQAQGGEKGLFARADLMRCVPHRRRRVGIGDVGFSRTPAYCNLSGAADRSSRRYVARGFQDDPSPFRRLPILPFGLDSQKGRLDQGSSAEIEANRAGHGSPQACADQRRDMRQMPRAIQKVRIRKGGQTSQLFGSQPSSMHGLPCVCVTRIPERHTSRRRQRRHQERMGKGVAQVVEKSQVDGGAAYGAGVPPMSQRQDPL